MKMEGAKKFLHGFRVAKTALVCVLGVPLFFIFSEVPANFIGSFLRVDPTYTGGLVAQEVVDPIGNAQEQGGLARYTVHQPVTGARWQRSAEYWQLVFDFNGTPDNANNTDNAVAQRSALVCIAADNMADGARPWNFVLKIDGSQGEVCDSAGSYICDAEVYQLNGGARIKVRIPLRDKRLQPLLGAKKTWHRIVLGGAIGANPSLALEKCADAVPVEAKMAAPKKSKAQDADDKAFVEQVKKMYEAAASNDFSASADAGSFNNSDAALEYYGQKIKENPSDCISLANYGSWLAKKGGESSALNAMKLVKEAYVYLDRAAELCAGKEGELEVLMNRASVSASVPETVFKKSEAGAGDFIKAASLADDKILRAYCFAMASDCYKKCGKESEAFLALQGAKKALE